MASLIKANAVPAKTAIPGLRELQLEDCPKVAVLLRAYMSRFDITPVFTDAEVVHYFYSGKGAGDPVEGRRKGQVTWSYVVEDPKTHNITDFFSFYYLPSTAMKANQIVEAAYLFYYATNVGQQGPEATTSEPPRWENESGSERLALKNRLVPLMQDALVVARDAKFDVFNAVTLLDNSLFIHQLKFGAGDGYLHYYLYNWMTRPIAGGILNDIGSEEGGDKVVTAPPPGLTLKECGSGIGVVML